MTYKLKLRKMPSREVKQLYTIYLHYIYNWCWFSIIVASQTAHNVGPTLDKGWHTLAHIGITLGWHANVFSNVGPMWLGQLLGNCVGPTICLWWANNFPTSTWRLNQHDCAVRVQLSSAIYYPIPDKSFTKSWWWFCGAVSPIFKTLMTTSKWGPPKLRHGISFF